MTAPQSKTIKQVLEDLLFNHMTRPGGECVDLALSDISKIIDECKPDYSKTVPRLDDDADFAIDQYQDNLRKAIK
jgi:hypothetical protein